MPDPLWSLQDVRYCIALIGSDDEDPAQLDRKVGYYGERLALTATQLGMGSVGWCCTRRTTMTDAGG